MTHKCPTCGTRLDIVRVERLLTSRQRMIRDAIEPVKRHTLRTAVRSEDLHAHLCSQVDAWHWSLRTLQIELKILSQMEIIWHPGNRKEGWDIKPDDIMIIPARAA